jgi:aminoglycoside N3'-acetyltransferase
MPWVILGICFEYAGEIMLKSFTKEEIKEQLAALEIPYGAAVIAHTALRCVGNVEGGASALFDLLLEHILSKSGVLCIPTHTWDKAADGAVSLDLTKDECCLGAFSKIALSKGGVRTENPTHSMALFGDPERVEALAELERAVSFPTAKDGAYAELAKGGYVLLVGVDQSKNTFLHAADEILGVHNRWEKGHYSVGIKNPSGEISMREWRMFDESSGDISHLFPKLETAFRYHGCIKHGFVGNAPTELCSAEGMLNVLRLIYERAGGYDPLSDDYPISPKLF